MEEKRSHISKQLAASGTKLVEKARKKSVHWINEDENQHEKSCSFDSPPKPNDLDVSLLKERIRRRKRHAKITKLKRNLSLSGPHFSLPSMAFASERSRSLPCEPEFSMFAEAFHESTQTQMDQGQRESYRQALAEIYKEQELEGQTL